MGTVVPFVSVSELLQRIGSRAWPIVIDVRREPASAIDPEMLPGAMRCAPENVGGLATRLAHGSAIVSYCGHGREVSQGAAAELRRAGLDARYLEGGIEGWRAVGAPLLRKSARLEVPGGSRSLRVTRERPKIDRIACPWLIRRFVDPRAEFRYVPTSEVLSCAEREGGIAFDIYSGRRDRARWRSLQF